MNQKEIVKLLMAIDSQINVCVAELPISSENMGEPCEDPFLEDLNQFHIQLNRRLDKEKQKLTDEERKAL